MRIKGKFDSGEIVVTSGIDAMLSSDAKTVKECYRLICRHLAGDWGDVCDEDKAENERSLIYGDRIMSQFTLGGEVVWIITEADRSVTTVLLRDEY